MPNPRKRHLRWNFLAWSVGLACLAAVPCLRAQRPLTQPPPLYATAVAGTQFVAFNLEAEKTRLIGDTGFPFSMGLAFCAPGGTAYTITNLFDPSKAQLATLDLDTGAATLVGSPLGQSLSIMGLTCSPDGTLYAVGQTDHNQLNFNSLYTVDRGSGQVTRVGSTGVLDPLASYSGFLMALAFAPDGTLYGANTRSLFTLDPATGIATWVLDFVGVKGVMGLAIDQDGNFYLADFVADSHIDLLDTSTQVAAPILDTGLARVHNIAFKSPN